VVLCSSVRHPGLTAPTHPFPSLHFRASEARKSKEGLVTLSSAQRGSTPSSSSVSAMVSSSKRTVKVLTGYHEGLTFPYERLFTVDVGSRCFEQSLTAGCSTEILPPLFSQLPVKSLSPFSSTFRVVRDHKSRRDHLSWGTIIVAALGRQFRGLNLRNPCPSVPSVVSLPSEAVTQSKTRNFAEMKIHKEQEK